MAPLLVVVLAGAVVVGGTIAPIDIKLNSVPAEKRRDIEAAIRQSTAALEVQPAFAARLARILDDEHFAVLLRVWRAEDCVRAELVYGRRGLPLPEHRLEEALAPGQRYFWTVRARFTADGLPAASPWAFFTSGLSGFLNEIPEGQYHRFITPKAN